MNQPDFQLYGFSDPRLAIHAAGSLPAWFWSADGSRVLWANPVGAKLFGAANGLALANRTFGPADAHRRQIAQLARRLPESGAMRLERLRGFGAPLGALATCGCARIDLPDGTHGVLITGTDSAGRSFPLADRLQRLVETSEAALAAFTDDGILAGASVAGRCLFGTRDLDDAGLAATREAALASGHAEAQLGSNRVLLYRVGSGRETGLVAVLMPDAPEASQPSTTEHEIPPASGTQAGEPMLDAVSPIAAALEQLKILYGTALTGATTTAPARSTDTVPTESDHMTAQDTPSPLQTIATPGSEPAISEPAMPADTPTAGPADGIGPQGVGTEAAGMESAGNVVPFRPSNETRFATLSPVENNAFHELARQLSARLEGEARTTQPDTPVHAIETEGMPVSDSFSETPPEGRAVAAETEAGAAWGGNDQPDWLAPDEQHPEGSSQRDRILLDLVPTGILIYRLDRLLYANAAFLSQMGYADLAALEQAGGLDALYVEPGASSSSGGAGAGRSVTISAADGSSSAELKAEARLFTISWDGDTAHALIFSPSSGSTAAEKTPAAAVASSSVPPPPIAPSQITPRVTALPAAGQASAEDIAAILDATAEGILMFDAGGNIHACNRSAEALFGYTGPELVRRNLTELLAPESTRLVLDYLDSVREAGTASVPDRGREVVGRVNHGGVIPLSIGIGRTQPDGPNFFAMFRDLSQTRRGESELLQARRLADRAADAKADMLSRISDEVRAPLNAIIDFAEVMIGERFGALGNARYGEYMKDIRASSERVITRIDDLLELSRIETGKLELAFTNQNLNDLVESCVAAMQPEANRARIIIRSSLSHALPPVVADRSSLRQIAVNLISTAISFARAGGQVIVSTAMSDFGEVMLRVRDTGHGLNDQDVAASLEPFRSQAPSEQASDGTGLNLSLTKALVEANRAQFHVKATPKSGTLFEVVFSRALARNQSLA
jgi:PAS domain S-box-containing protein